MAYHGKPSNLPLYSSTQSPPYQIDFQVQNRGKRVAATKRCVKWRFGFSNAEALANGGTGTDCRGSEHDVALVWSITSGKRLVLMDGVDVHYALERSKSKIECSWTVSGQHVFKLIAHAAPPLQPLPDFRQFDLLLDGRSFFDFPQIYELGMTTRAQRMPVQAYPAPAPPVYAYATAPIEGNGQYGNQYALPSSEDRPPRAVEYHGNYNYDNAPAVPQQTEVSSNPQSLPVDPVPTPDLVSDPSPTNQAQDLISAPVPPVALLDQQNNNFQPSAVPPVAPVEPPAPSYEQVSSEILQNYGAPAPLTGAIVPAAPSQAYSEAITPSSLGSSNFGSVASPPSHATPAASYGPPPSTAAYPMSPMAPVVAPQPDVAPVSYSPSPVQTPTAGEEDPTTPRQSMTFDNYYQESEESPSGVNDFDRTVRSLVNLEDITSTPQEQEAFHKLTMAPPVDPQSTKKKKKAASQPLPPTSPTWAMGAAASLGQIKQVTDQIKSSKTPTQVMKPTEHTTAGGALVVYGNGMRGPPPLQQVRGFGVGALMENGGYTQTRQELPLPYAVQQ